MVYNWDINQHNLNNTYNFALPIVWTNWIMSDYYLLNVGQNIVWSSGKSRDRKQQFIDEHLGLIFLKQATYILHTDKDNRKFGFCHCVAPGYMKSEQPHDLTSADLSPPFFIRSSNHIVWSYTVCCKRKGNIYVLRNRDMV